MDFPRPSMSASEHVRRFEGQTWFRRRSFGSSPTITTMIPTTTTMPIPSQLRVLMILVTTRDTYGDPYDRLEYTTRSTGSSRSAGSRSSRLSSAQLVSSGDIRATTSAYGVSDVAAKPTMELPSVSHRTEAEEKKSVSKIAEDFSIPASSYTDFVSPYKQSLSASASSSAGLDSLFTPSAAPSGSVSGLSDGANVAPPMVRVLLARSSSSSRRHMKTRPRSPNRFVRARLWCCTFAKPIRLFPSAYLIFRSALLLPSLRRLIALPRRRS